MKKNRMDTNVLPKIGQKERGFDIGKNTSTKYIYLACQDCGQKRWVQFVTTKSPSQLCRQCSGKRQTGSWRGEKSPRWKGGRRIRWGYVKVWLNEDDFFFPMVDSEWYVFEHRLVMAKHIGRCLHRWEIVHHKNGVKNDNRIENLQLVTDDRHKQITIMEQRIKVLERRVTLLEAENVLLGRGASYAEKSA